MKLPHNHSNHTIPVRTCRGATNNVQWLAEWNTNQHVRGSAHSQPLMHGYMLELGFLFWYFIMTHNNHIYGWNNRPHPLNWRSLLFTAAHAWIFWQICHQYHNRKTYTNKRKAAFVEWLLQVVSWQQGGVTSISQSDIQILLHRDQWLNYEFFLLPSKY